MAALKFMCPVTGRNVDLTPKASQVCRAKAQSWFVRIAISHTFSLAFPRGWSNFNPNTSDLPSDWVLSSKSIMRPPH